MRCDFFFLSCSVKWMKRGWRAFTMSNYTQRIIDSPIQLKPLHCKIMNVERGMQESRWNAMLNLSQHPLKFACFLSAFTSFSQKPLLYIGYVWNYEIYQRSFRATIGKHDGYEKNVLFVLILIRFFQQGTVCWVDVWFGVGLMKRQFACQFAFN